MKKNNESVNCVFIPVEIHQSKYYDALNLAEIMTLSGGMADVIYFPDSDVPKEIKGKFTTGIIKTPEDAVAALTSVREVMFIDDISFVCTGIEEEEHITSFYLQQVYNGIMVMNGTFRVIATPDGEPVAVIGLYINGIDLDTTPTLNAKEVEKSVVLERGTRISESKLVVYKDYDGIVRLCWLFTVSSRDPLKEKEIAIDANTGELVASFLLSLF
jgi:Zn-dependent metalloprotease